MLWLADTVRAAGWRVARFNFAYRTERRPIPDRMPKLIQGYRDAVARARAEGQPEVLICGGHSMGGRVASMMLSEEPLADALLLFGYPLHAPDRLDRLRDAHLPAISVPVLQMNGTNDAFCDRSLMEGVLSGLNPARWTMHWIHDADHSYAVKKASGRTRADVTEEVLGALKAWTTTTFP
jgi:hypothetical protein